MHGLVCEDWHWTSDGQSQEKIAETATFATNLAIKIALCAGILSHSGPTTKVTSLPIPLWRSICSHIRDVHQSLLRCLEIVYERGSWDRHMLDAALVGEGRLADD
eukprot:747254-Hanusia_phi.AAC.6